MYLVSGSHAAASHTEEFHCAGSFLTSVGRALDSVPRVRASNMNDVTSVYSRATTADEIP